MSTLTEVKPIVIEMYNGNGQLYTRSLPKLRWFTDHINDVALLHIEKQTGLKFVKGNCSDYSCQPISYDQIVKLFLTYNFKTQYNDNSTNKNVILLKSDHHVGFMVDSICLECCKANHIHADGLNPGDRLSC